MRRGITTRARSEDNARSVPIGTLTLVKETLCDLGINGTEFLRTMGIEPGFLEHPLTPISVVTVGKIVAQAIRQSGCAHFSVVMGARARLDNAGVLPILLTNEVCVRDAIADLVRFLRIWYLGMHFDLHVDAGTALLTVDVSGAFEGHTELCTSYTASMLHHLETCIGSEWRATYIHLARRRPKDVAPYLRIFRAPVSFDQPENGIVFSASVLDRRREAVDARLRTYLHDQLRQLEVVGGSIVDQVQRLIKVLLVQGSCRIERVAELMAMHRKTLHRLLRGEGTTFEDELDRTRRHLSEQMLSGSLAPISEIAQALGYTSPANFARAFRRWHAMSPSAWRRQGTQ